MKANHSTYEADAGRRPTTPEPLDRAPQANSAADGHSSSPDGKSALPVKKPCDAPEGWCRVCERMSDIPILRSEDLLQGHREVLILHGKEVYRLLCTRNGKLILQK